MAGLFNINPGRGWYEEAKTRTYNNIADAYSAIGTSSHPTRIYIINNFTDTNIWISFDGATNHIAIPAGGHYVEDIATNGISLPGSTTFYVKRFTAGVAPTSGTVVVSVGYII